MLTVTDFIKILDKYHSSSEVVDVDNVDVVNVDVVVCVTQFKCSI